MGYTIFRVRNEEFHTKPDKIAEDIKELYYQLYDAENNKKDTIITELKKPLKIQPIPKGLIIDQWVQKLNEELVEEVKEWSIDKIKEVLYKFPPELIKNQCAMEKFILSLFGYKLKIKNGSLDFEYSLEYFKKSLELLNDLLPENGNMAAIHLKNMFNETAPGFFKNLIFKGRPNRNERLISIKDKDTLNFHIDSFNKYLSELGITVERSDIIQECKATLQKFREEDKIVYKWILDG